MAINWRQVAAPDFSGASEILQRAVNNLTGGFDRLGGAIGGFGEARGKVASNRALDILSRVQTEAGVAPAMDQVSSLVRPSEMTPALQLAMTQLAPQASQMDNRRTLAGIATDENARAQTRFGWEGDARATREATAGVLASRWENAINQGVGPGSIAPDSVYAAASEAFRPHIDRILPGESQGNFDALYKSGNSVFAGVKPTQMTVDQWLAFQKDRSPSSYGSYVRANNGGTLSTPMGGYQIVGDTLEAAKKGMGLKGDEMMTPEMQTRVADWIFQTQGTGAWEGYGNGGGNPVQMRAYNQDPLASQLSPEDLAAVARNGLMGEFIKDPYTQYNTVRTNEASSFASELTNEQNAVAWSDTLQARAEAAQLKIDTERMIPEVDSWMRSLGPGLTPEQVSQAIDLNDKWDLKKKGLVKSILGNELADARATLDLPAAGYVMDAADTAASGMVGNSVTGAQDLAKYHGATDADALSLGLSLQTQMAETAATISEDQKMAEAVSAETDGKWLNGIDPTAVNEAVGDVFNRFEERGQKISKSTIMSVARAAIENGTFSSSIDPDDLEKALGAWVSAEKFTSVSAQNREIADLLSQTEGYQQQLAKNQADRAAWLNGTRGDPNSPQVQEAIKQLDLERDKIVNSAETGYWATWKKIAESDPAEMERYKTALAAEEEKKRVARDGNAIASDAARALKATVNAGAAKTEAINTGEIVTSALARASGGGGEGAAGRSATSQDTPQSASVAQDDGTDDTYMLNGVTFDKKTDQRVSGTMQPIPEKNSSNRSNWDMFIGGDPRSNAITGNLRTLVQEKLPSENIAAVMWNEQFMTQSDKEAARGRRAATGEVRDWFLNEGPAFFDQHPEMMEEAYRDPVAFYNKHRKNK